MASSRAPPRDATLTLVQTQPPGPEPRTVEMAPLTLRADVGTVNEEERSVEVT
jgi:hypothetical protein